MDHSIFGSLMDINGDIKEESHCSEEEIYTDEQSNTCAPEGSVEEEYSSAFYPLAVHIEDVAAPQAEGSTAPQKKIAKSPSKKTKKVRSKKKLTSKCKELRFKCPQCDYRTWKKSNYQRHLLTHNKKLYKCTLCPFSAKHADDLAKHIAVHKKKEPSPPNNRNHEKPRSVTGTTGKKEIKTEPSWSYSGTASTPVSTSGIKCEIKEEPEIYTPPVEVYLVEPSSNSCVPESSVDEEYDSDFFPLAVHLDVANPHEGPIAPKQIKNSEITINKTKVPCLKNSKELRYSCPYCSYRTWKTSNFQRHLCTHTNERPHKCHLCKYSGKHHEDLKKHMLCHNKEITFAAIETVPENELMKKTVSPVKRFACLLCDFKTTRSSMLNRHQRVVHNDNRPYACDLCPYRSKQRDSLKKHMMSHTDERPFECEICHHKCRQKGDLKRHQLLHTGERPFACPHCPYRSNRTQLLKKHISRRHCIPQESSEITMSKNNLIYEEFTGGHYLAEMF